MTSKIKELIKRSVHLLGYDLRKTKGTGSYGPSRVQQTFGLTKIQYACGPKLLKDWVNVDYYPAEFMKKRFGMDNRQIYYQVDLSQKQPFPDNSFAVAFAEDFIEHLTQGDSIIFLYECLRVLKEGGVLRLSFPGLEGVLKRHFSRPEHNEIIKGVQDAYRQYEHVHFYSREELELVARHLGFSHVQFVDFGCSSHDELRGLETREKQQDLNIYAELTK